MKTLETKYQKQTLENFLEEFNWNFERMIGEAHPTQISSWNGNNHTHDQKQLAAVGNLEEGSYQNAAMACSKCYHSNPATLVWSKSGNYIKLHSSPDSSKPEKFKKIVNK